MTTRKHFFPIWLFVTGLLGFILLGTVVFDGGIDGALNHGNMPVSEYKTANGEPLYRARDIIKHDHSRYIHSRKKLWVIDIFVVYMFICASINMILRRNALIWFFLKEPARFLLYGWASIPLAILFWFLMVNMLSFLVVSI